jgi:hypothetical protein
MHGSLTWLLDGEKIVLNHNLDSVTGVKEALSKIPSDALLEVTQNSSPTDLISSAASLTVTDEIAAFVDAYKELAVVNPSKDKFEKTVMQQAYYDLLRQYSNELEREASSLFVIGFSFADEHIRSLTVRAANSNPTLLIFVFCHSVKTKVAIEESFKEESFIYDNVRFISPDDIVIEEIDVKALDLAAVTRILQSTVNPHENVADPQDENEKVDEQARSE